jgi:hypothetical protein
VREDSVFGVCADFCRDISAGAVPRERNHLMHLVALGRLYMEEDKVRRILAPQDGVKKRILDLGQSDASLVPIHFLMRTRTW